MTIGWWVLQQTVTILLLVAVALIACRLLRNRPALCHAIWLVVLIKFLMPPGISWPVAVDVASLAWLAGEQEQSADLAVAPDPRPAIEQRKDQPPGDALAVPFALIADSNVAQQSISADTIDPSAAQAVRTAEAAVASPADQTASPAVGSLLGRWLLRALLVTWLCGSIVTAWRQWKRITVYSRIVQAAAPAPVALQAEFARLATLMQAPTVSVVVADSVTAPFVWCVGRSRVVWPASLADELDFTRWEGVMAHELAHLCRRDHLVAWLELLASVVWWWNPLWLFTRRQLHETSEMACDALVVHRLPEGRRAYADAFLQLSAFRSPDEWAPALGVGSKDSQSFERRLKMILNSRLTARLSLPGLSAVILIGCLVAPGWSLGQTAPGSSRDTESPKQGATTPSETPAIDKAADLKTADDDDAPEHRTMILQENSSGEIVLKEKKIVKAAVDDPELAGVTMTGPNRMRLTGKKVGKTILTVWDDEEKRTRFELLVEAAAASEQPVASALTQAPSQAPEVPKAARLPTTEGTMPTTKLDLTALGLAIIEAQGELELAKHHFQAIQGLVEQSVVSKEQPKEYAIKVRTAESKLAFLARIAQSAYDAAKEDLEYEQKIADRLAVLASEKLVGAEQLASAKRKLRAAQAQVQMLRALPNVRDENAEPKKE